MIDYHVSRNGKTLGVYPEADARHYYAQGRISPDDLVWHEGMPAWVAAGQVFGPSPLDAAPWPSPVPVPTAVAPPAAGAAPGSAPAVPPPPRLHWALVLLLTLVTFGIFFVAWIFVQAAWIKKIHPKSKAMTLLVVYLVLVLLGQVIAAASQKDSSEAAVASLLVLAGSVVSIVAIFSMRRSMLNYYNGVEPIGLRLSGVLTFFLGVFYLQYHMTRIARWKESGVLPL
ncbi:DUF4339 domain-containing protein [Caenimonas terrae]|uniref:DUF4339 domain-containing protein n=1 Tax=Caenimonas terrae TaxID=696074 RepID=A0ABW0NJ77_9BURK